MEFFSRNMDYVLFIYGLSFVLLAVLCRGLARENPGKLLWAWLGLFGLFHGFAKWLDVLAFSLADNDSFLTGRLALELISYICLLEFGRSGFRRGDRPVIGAWILPPLALLTALLGMEDGTTGLKAVSHFTLAFPGSFLAMLALAPAVPQKEDAWKHRGLIFSAASLLAFGLTNWVTPGSILHPSRWMSDPLFQLAMTFPLHLWQAVALMGVITGLWIYRHRLAMAQRPRSFPWLTPLLLITLLTLGWVAAEHRESNLDAEQRNRLLEQVSALARAINPGETKLLTFSPADAENPRHQRLQNQLQAVRHLQPCQSISSIALRRGLLVYGPCAFTDSEPVPGDSYRPAPVEDVTRLFRGEPYVIGPTVLRGAPVISARAPVRDLQTGQVLMTIGIDVDPAPWRAKIAQARLIPITGTMVLLLALLIGIDMIRTREDIPLERQGATRHLEAILILFCGVVSSLFIALLIQESELRRRHSVFDRLADSRTNQIRDEMLAIRADLQSLALFFESSDYVSRTEFATFVTAIIQADAVEAFAWIPLVTDARKAAFEEDMSRQLPRRFSIWEQDREGLRSLAPARPRYFPVAYIEPHAENADVPGFNLGSDPVAESTFRQTLASGLWSATPALPLPHQPARKPVILALQPVQEAAPAPRPAPSNPPLTGFAAGIIRPDNLLMRASSRSGLGERFVNLGLVDMTDVHHPRLMAARPLLPGQPYDRLGEMRAVPLVNLQPIFAFGRTFAVICQPTREFWLAYPVRGSLTAGAGAALLSLLLALFVAFLRKRQWDLECEVTQRTEALRLSQENLAITLNSIGDGVIATDARGIVRQLNPAAERLTGWPAIAAEGLPLSTIFHIVNSRTRERVLNPVDRVVATGHVVGLANHTALIARNGTERQISDSAAPILDATGATIGVVLVFSDVTQEYADRLKLEESEMQYRLLAEYASDVIARIGLDGKYLFVSPSSAHVLGYEPAEVIGRNMLDAVHPDDSRKALATFKKALAHPAGSSVILRVKHKDGRYRWLETAGRRVRDPQTGTANEIIIVSRDISERKNAEDDRLDMERRLLHTQKLESLGVLTGGIAHDFNNLLTAMLGNMELAQVFLKENDPARKGIEQAILAAKRAADLTRQMLAYSGKGLFAVKDLNLNAVVEENANMLKAAISKTVTLNLDLTPNLPTVKADASQIQQIIMNLITNASEAIGDKPGVVTLATGVDPFDADTLAHSRLPEKPAPGRFLWLDVSDTGAGMSADTMARIFEPFFTTKFPGRGLGMSVVLGIMRGHNGAIFMDSQLDRGTTIRILFPVQPKHPGAQAPLPSAPPARRKPGPPTPPDAPDAPPQGGTVLVVDDEQIVQEICAAAVTYSGYKTLTASDGEEGVAVFREHADEIVCVILDLTMPRMDGATAFREMRRIRPDVRVILSSGHAEQEAFRRFDSEGAAGFLQKPYELSALQAELERVIRGRPA
jgi:PAS domain S-box-containing protein